MARKTKQQILKEEQEKKQKEVTSQWITSVILFALALIGIMKLGVVGTFLYNLCRYLIGDRFLLLFGLALGMRQYGFWLGDALAGFTPFVIGLFFYFSGRWTRRMS